MDLPGKYKERTNRGPCSSPEKGQHFLEKKGGRGGHKDHWNSQTEHKKTDEGSSPEAKERDCFKVLREDKEKQGLKMSIHNHTQPLKVRCG